MDGKYIKEGNGNEIILRGMGLGGWMLQEPYMFQMSGVAANQKEMRSKMEKVAGKEATDKFYTDWLKNACTKADVDSMAAWGFNSIRLPMHYNLYTLPIEQEKDSMNSTLLETGFRMTDELLKWCEANRIYLILDLHAAPGGQGADVPISDRDMSLPSLWASKANQKKTIDLWRELAKRYANEKWIGGYDLINETNFGFTNKDDKNGCNEKVNAELKGLLTDITNAIREVDKNHIIYIEGNCWANNYNGMFPLWDNNMVVSFHKYWNYNTQDAIANFIKIRDEQNVPLWLGESGENSNVWFADAISLMERNKIGWAWWPLKKMGQNNPLQIIKPEGYDQMLEAMEDEGRPIAKEEAIRILNQVAENAKISNNVYRHDVVDAMFRQVKSNQVVPYKPHQLHEKLKVFAVDFDLGRSGYAYHDVDSANYWVSNQARTPGNTGGQYRNDAVDITTSDDKDGNGYAIGWMEPGEWLQYTVHTSREGTYSMSVSNKKTGDNSGELLISVNDVTSIASLPLSDNTSWNVTSPQMLTLKKGSNSIRLQVVKGGSDISYFDLHYRQTNSIKSTK